MCVGCPLESVKAYVEEYLTDRVETINMELEGFQVLKWSIDTPTEYSIHDAEKVFDLWETITIKEVLVVGSIS